MDMIVLVRGGRVGGEFGRVAVGVERSGGCGGGRGLEGLGRGERGFFWGNEVVT